MLLMNIIDKRLYLDWDTATVGFTNVDQGMAFLPAYWVVGRMMKGDGGRS